MQEKQVQELVRATNSRLCELFEGFILIALVPPIHGADEVPVVITHPGSLKTNLALRAMLHDYVMTGHCPPDEGS